MLVSRISSRFPRAIVTQCRSSLLLYFRGQHVPITVSQFHSFRDFREKVFKKFGVGKYDPTNEEFDPNKHNAVFQVPDPKKAPGMVAVCLKSGYMLHDRIIRPAEVGVTVAMENTQVDERTEA